MRMGGILILMRIFRCRSRLRAVYICRLLCMVVRGVMFGQWDALEKRWIA